ncbi:hypothetical protein [Paraburkholderia fungorum]|uniref:hypothetical protein n=1 Tax=Paraburkholderia fungorum TaxID=134537 RepID=UPI002092BF5D|nr:hypothetical protein [Paraburkholderia fungorum]USU16102.1 hypothetical protein NFE55_21520 [Paraburkholderia fungorum]USU24046.1 hypothetical protein NFS19_21515 [Paraburkholderia fungorum]
MSIAKTLQPPDWIDSGAEIAGGLDLLGLRLPVQVIGNAFLDGVTTVTPSVRYLSFRAWLIQSYGQTGGADSLNDFTDFAARVESALVLGNLLVQPSITGLIGSDEARARLARNESRVPVSSLVKQPAATIYTGPSDQLGISKSRGNAVPSLVAQRGVPLAKAVSKRLDQIGIVKHLFSQDLLDVPVDDLRELGAVARIDEIPDDERDLLVNAIVPAAPRRDEQERARIGTYASLLVLAGKLKTQPREIHFFDAACSPDGFSEPLLDRAADGWATFCVRDAIAVTQEGVLAAVMDEIFGQQDGGIAGVNRNMVITALMQRVEEHDSAMRDLGLVSDHESVADFTFRELEARLRMRLRDGSGAANTVARWSDKLTEPMLYRRALKSGAGALSLAPVAWIMAAQRVGHLVREDGKQYGQLSYQGWRRLGVREVVLPELERFHRENLSWREVAAELALRTVQQHLQITWSRLQSDLTRDVALLTTEGNRWFPRGKGFAAGRTGARIHQALGWLSQLKLIDTNGLTADGQIVLRRALEALKEEVSA